MSSGGEWNLKSKEKRNKGSYILKITMGRGGLHVLSGSGRQLIIILTTIAAPDQINRMEGRRRRVRRERKYRERKTEKIVRV